MELEQLTMWTDGECPERYFGRMWCDSDRLHRRPFFLWPQFTDLDRFGQ